METNNYERSSIKLRREMQVDAHGHNKVITERVTRFMEPEILLCHVHPLNRVEYAKRLFRLKMITKFVYKEYVNY